MSSHPFLLFGAWSGDATSPSITPPAGQTNRASGWWSPRSSPAAAVLRNLVKRIGRDVFRHAHASLPRYDVVLRLSAPLASVTKRQMREDMLGLFGRLPR